MKNEIKNLQDLFAEQGRELYDSSLREEKELVFIENHASNITLKNIIHLQLKNVTNQRKRLYLGLKALKIEAEGEVNECCQAVLSKTQKLIERSTNSKIKDAIIINAIQRLNHTKIASLGSLVSYAKEIGHPEISHSIRESLREEKAFDKLLTNLAEKKINSRALVPLLL